MENYTQSASDLNDIICEVFDTLGTEKSRVPEYVMPTYIFWKDEQIELYVNSDNVFVVIANHDTVKKTPDKKEVVQFLFAEILQ